MYYFAGITRFDPVIYLTGSEAGESNVSSSGHYFCLNLTLVLMFECFDSIWIGLKFSTQHRYPNLRLVIFRFSSCNPPSILKLALPLPPLSSRSIFSVILIPASNLTFIPQTVKSMLDPQARQQPSLRSRIFLGPHDSVYVLSLKLFYCLCMSVCL